MAFERAQFAQKILGEDLASFVDGKIKQMQTQLKVRNAQDELNFSRAVLENNISLNDQLAYRQAQLSRVSDDPEEKRRVTQEISSLKDRIESQKFNDDYTQQLINHESGMSSVDTVLSWLRGRLSVITDPKMHDQIQKEILSQESQKFSIQQSAIKDATQYALNDKSSQIINDQMNRLKKAQSDALFSNNRDLADTYNLQIQSLQQAADQNTIEQDLKNFAIGTLADYHSAVGLLDSYNAKIMTSSTTTPVTVNGVKYNSSQEFWRFRRDSYVSDQSGSGLLARLGDEQKTSIMTKMSNNTLSNADITSSSSLFDSLIHRPELASYAAQIMNVKQDVVQSATDAQAKRIYEKYTASLDVNKAVASLNALKALGGNVEGVYNQILLGASQVKQGQVSNILNTAKQLMNDNPGMTPSQAIDRAVSTGAGLTLSPEQLTGKTEKQIASESLTAAQGGKVKTDTRTTLSPEAQQSQGQPQAQVQDLSSKYGLVGKAVYDKSTGVPFTTEQEFFNATGLNSFQGVTFDTNYKPPAQVNAQPSQAEQQLAPPQFDTNAATGDDYLAIANIAWEVSGSAKQQQEQYGSPSIDTFSGNRASYMKAAQDVAAGRSTGNSVLDEAVRKAIQQYSQSKQPAAQTTPTQQKPTTQAKPQSAQPVKPAQQAQSTQPTYTVASGDTLSAISKRLLGDPNRYMEIAKLNKLPDPNKINPGQKLILPKK